MNIQRFVAIISSWLICYGKDLSTDHSVPISDDETTAPGSVAPLDLGTTVNPTNHFSTYEEKNIKIDHVNKSYTSISMRWSTSVSGVLNFYVYYSIVEDNKTNFSVNTPLNVSGSENSAHLVGLQSGTKYSFFINASTSDGANITSSKNVFTTLGYGPEKRCNCSDLGTIPDTKCDPKTGQCQCKNNGTQGLSCNICAKDYYLYRKTGCEKCDCPEYRSDGSCQINGQIVECNCRNHFVGAKCTSCDKGYYLLGSNCKACDCSGNEDSNEDYCDRNTGICLACTYNTTGDHCEKCLEGYIGDAVLQHDCTLISEVEEKQAGLLSHSTSLALGICLSLLLIVVIVLGVVIWRRYCRRKPALQFWTVELKDDHEQVNFSALMEQPEYQITDPFSLHDDSSYYDRASAPANTTANSDRTRIVKNKPKSDLYQSLGSNSIDA